MTNQKTQVEKVDQTELSEIDSLKAQVDHQTLLNQLNDKSMFRMMLLQSLQQIAIQLTELKILRELLEDYLNETEEETEE